MDVNKDNNLPREDQPQPASSEKNGEASGDKLPNSGESGPKSSTTATMKFFLPQVVEDQSQLTIVEKMMSLQGIELPSTPPPDMEKLPEARWEKYTVVGSIARQNFRHTLLVRDENTHRLAVMKVLQASPQLEQDQMQRFLQEAQLQAQLIHPAIIPVYDIGIDVEGQLYYTMPYIPGRSLPEYYRAGPPEDGRGLFPTLFCFYCICRAVAYLHERGVLHRSLAPENIYVDTGGMSYLSGLSLSLLKNKGMEVFDQAANHQIRNCGKLTTSDGRRVGNLYFMAPEVICEKMRYVDERADIYALGGILYYLMVGAPPFESPTFPETIEQICDTKRDVPKKKTRFSISGNIAYIIKKAMTTNRTERYQSVLELVSELEKKVLYKGGF